MMSRQTGMLTAPRRRRSDHQRTTPLGRRFARDQSGAVMLETAVVLLVLVPLLLGLAELSDALTLKRRVETAAATAGDLVTRATEEGKPVTTAELEQVRALLDRIVESGSGTVGPVGLRVVRFSVVDDGDANGKSSKTIGRFSCKFVGDGVNTIPKAVLDGMKANDEIVLVETQSKYSSRLARLISEPITLHGISYFTPRIENEIELENVKEEKCR